MFPCRLCCCLLSCSFSSCRGNGFCSANSACVIFDNWDAEGGENTHTPHLFCEQPPRTEKKWSVHHCCCASDRCCTHKTINRCLLYWWNVYFTYAFCQFTPLVCVQSAHEFGLQCFLQLSLLFSSSPQPVVYIPDLICLAVASLNSASHICYRLHIPPPSSPPLPPPPFNLPQQ